jgi:hypothetical protein
VKTRTKRFIKLTIGAELRKQIVVSIKVRRGPCDDGRDFKPVVKKAHAIKPLKVGIGDKGYDDEKNHEFLRDELHAMSIIPARYQDVPVWRTHGRYRKEMKRGYSKKKYHQRSKDETIFSVVKRTMGDEVRSVRTKAQNNEMRLKIIAYNAARIASLTGSLFVGFLQSQLTSRHKYARITNVIHHICPQCHVGTQAYASRALRASSAGHAQSSSSSWSSRSHSSR